MGCGLCRCPLWLSLWGGVAAAGRRQARVGVAARGVCADAVGRLQRSVRRGRPIVQCVGFGETTAAPDGYRFLVAAARCSAAFSGAPDRSRVVVISVVVCVRPTWRRVRMRSVVCPGSRCSLWLPAATRGCLRRHERVRWFRRGGAAPFLRASVRACHLALVASSRGGLELCASPCGC